MWWPVLVTSYLHAWFLLESVVWTYGAVDVSTAAGHTSNGVTLSRKTRRTGNIYSSKESRSKRNTELSSHIIDYKKEALICPPGCASCSTHNGCLACKQRYFLLLLRYGMRQTGVCRLTCPTGFYGVRRQHFSVCLKCNADKCEACFSKNYCTRCESPYVAYKGKCINGCPNGYYYANYSKECHERVNCMVGSWTSWNSCSRNGQTCGYKYGIEARSRHVLQLPSPNGERCPTLSENQKCKMVMRSCADLATNRSDPARRMKSGIRRWKRRRKHKKRGKKKRQHRRGKKRRGKKKRRRNKKRRRKQKTTKLIPKRSKLKLTPKRVKSKKSNPKNSISIETNEISSKLPRSKG
ncbi:R-spondin-2 [Octopus bimaculoides]|nr:R-spondin-2 [Octopus bimaculoides]|eukprot:XP_014773412.1 PREDICTED: R-spondin-2-like [Octopus bimaculoides]